MKIEFIKSAVKISDFPTHRLPEIAIAGRSNAGKSSFINTLGLRNIALVSNTPGKTRLLNFFNFKDKFVLVDMPGYGFASRSGGEQHSWESMIEGYLLQRPQLVGLILIMDSRREWTEDEELLKRFSDSEGFPMIVVLTKTDKLSKSETLNAIRKIKKQCGVEVFGVSSLKKLGQKEVENYFFKNWIKDFDFKTIQNSIDDENDENNNN